MPNLLWSVFTQVEAIRLLVRLWHECSDDERRELADAVMAGPPQELFAEDVEEAERQTLGGREVLRRLVALQNAGAELPPAAVACLTDLSQKFPDSSHSDEFPVKWSNRPLPTMRAAAHLSNQTVGQLLQTYSGPKPPDFFDSAAFVESAPRLAVALALEASGSGFWPANLWAALLGEAATGARPELSDRDVTRSLLDALIAAPPEVLVSFALGLAHFLRGRRGTIEQDWPETFWRMWDRALSAGQLQKALGTRGDIDEAMNHPVGILAEIVLDPLGDVERKAGERFSTDIITHLDRLTELGNPSLRPSRLLVASRLNYLFAVDPGWVTRSLLPAFDWSCPEEARVVWTGYLWQPRISRDLFAVLAPHLEDAVAHSSVLEDRAARSLGMVVAAVGINLPGAMADDTAHRCLRGPDQRVRVGAAEQTEARMDESGDKGALVWRDRIAGWLSRVWPLDPQLQDGETSANLAGAIIHAGEAFPEAVQLMQDRIMPTKDAPHLLHEMQKRIVTAFPAWALALALRVVPRERGATFGLQTFLDAVEKVLPNARALPEFRQLEDRL